VKVWTPGGSYAWLREHHPPIKSTRKEKRSKKSLERVFGAQKEKRCEGGVSLDKWKPRGRKDNGKIEFEFGSGDEREKVGYKKDLI